MHNIIMSLNKLYCRRILHLIALYRFYAQNSANAWQIGITFFGVYYILTKCSEVFKRIHIDHKHKGTYKF